MTPSLGRLLHSSAWVGGPLSEAPSHNKSTFPMHVTLVFDLAAPPLLGGGPSGLLDFNLRALRVLSNMILFQKSSVFLQKI